MKRIALGITILLLLIPTNGNAYGISDEYTDLNNNKVNFSTLEGTPVLIEAFATDCPHCHDQHPELVDVYNKFNDSIEMMSISVSSDDSLQKIKDYLNEYPSPWIVGLDEDGSFGDSYDISGTPSMLLFDSSGTFANCFVGTHESSTLKVELTRFLENSTAYIESNAGNSQCNSSGGSLLNSYLLPIAFVITLSIGIIILRKEF